MSPPLNPLSLSVPEAALLMSRASGKPVTEEMIRAAVADGCPVDARGRLNLVHLAAWINKESHDGD